MNEKGERVFDTVIKPQYENLTLEKGLRHQLNIKAKEESESITTVRERVLNLVKDKKVVGYHLP